MNRSQQSSFPCNNCKSEQSLREMWRLSRLLRFFALILFCAAFSADLRADTISGTVKDPSSAIVAGARIEITGENLTQPILLVSDESGKFAAPDLKPGKYSVRVIKDGFEPLTTAIDLHGVSDLQLKLAIAEQQTSVNVTDKSLAFANSDAFYHQLRDVALGDTYVCEKFIFNMDAGNFELTSG